MPEEPSGRGAWVLGRPPRPTTICRLGGTTVGGRSRLSQHHAAFDLEEATFLGREPRLVDDNAYTTGHQAVAAITRLDPAPGRQPEIEPPERSVGLSPWGHRGRERLPPSEHVLRGGRLRCRPSRRKGQLSGKKGTIAPMPRDSRPCSLGGTEVTYSRRATTCRRWSSGSSAFRSVS